LRHQVVIKPASVAPAVKQHRPLIETLGSRGAQVTLCAGIRKFRFTFMYSLIYDIFLSIFNYSCSYKYSYGRTLGFLNQKKFETLEVMQMSFFRPELSFDRAQEILALQKDWNLQA
jgi:hypothetical protein